MKLEKFKYIYILHILWFSNNYSNIISKIYEYRYIEIADINNSSEIFRYIFNFQWFEVNCLFEKNNNYLEINYRNW